jgi:hypothetical protein
MDGGVERRGFQLVGYPTRVLRQRELHELIVTDEAPLDFNARVDRVAYQGFVEIGQAGVVARGNHVTIGGQVVGFDECHLPNHLNVIIYSPDRRGGQSRGLAIGDTVSFEQAAP